MVWDQVDLRLNIRHLAQGFLEALVVLIRLAQQQYQDKIPMDTVLQLGLWGLSVGLTLLEQVVAIVAVTRQDGKQSLDIY